MLVSWYEKEAYTRSEIRRRGKCAKAVLIRAMTGTIVHVDRVLGECRNASNDLRIIFFTPLMCFYSQFLIHVSTVCTLSAVGRCLRPRGRIGTIPGGPDIRMNWKTRSMIEISAVA